MQRLLPVLAAQDNSLLQAVSIAKALGDETRLRIMAMLEPQELCACQIIEVFDLANSTISRHLSVLKQAGLLQSRKSGRWIYYFWPKAPSPALQSTQRWLSAMIHHDLQIQQDRQHMIEILKIDPEALCRRQNDKECC